MILNPDIIRLLSHYRIDKSAGLLVLLGYYFNLDVDSVCPENIVKAISTTKIVEKDYSTHEIKWNVPLFEGQETAFKWVEEWIEKFTRVNPTRGGDVSSTTKLMRQFFAKYPQYRITDVNLATDNYIADQVDPKFILTASNFIFEGKTGIKKSKLLEYLEKMEKGGKSNQMRGKIL